MIKELENKKTELEKAFEERKKHAQTLENDIALISQLIALKREHAKVLSEMNSIIVEHGEVCKAIETNKEMVVEEETK